MERLKIMREQVPHFIHSQTDFRWGSMTGYTNYQGDYIVKVFGEVVATWAWDEDSPSLYTFSLNNDWAMDNKYVPMIMKAYFWEQNGHPTDKLFGN